MAKEELKLANYRYQLLNSQEKDLKYSHLVPVFQVIDINQDSNDFDNLPNQLNIFKQMNIRINKRLFDEESDFEQAMVDAEIKSQKKKFKQ